MTTTTTGTDLIAAAAHGLLADEIITDYNRVADDCGCLTLVRLDFADGTYIVAGAEYADDGETVDGYSWTAWSPADEGPGVLFPQEDQPLETDGGTDINRFAADMRRYSQRGRWSTNS